MNELLFLVLTVVGLGFTLLSFYLGGKGWLKALIGINIVLANIFVLKQFSLFGIAATGGNVVYGSIFLATDLLSEHWGKKEAREGVWIGFYFALFFLVTSQLILLFEPSPWDTIHPSLLAIFTFAPRVVASSLLAYMISQHFDIWSFNKIREALPEKKWLWLRNNGSTLSSQLLDSILFTILAFLGTFPLHILLEIIFTTYVLKLLVGLMDTPFIYLSYKILQVKPLKELPWKRSEE